MGFSRQEYWSGLPRPSPGDLPDPGMEPVSPASPSRQPDSLPAGPSGKTVTPDFSSSNSLATTNPLPVPVVLSENDSSEGIPNGGHNIPTCSGTVTGAQEAGWRTVSELWASERVLCALRDG